MYKEKAFNFISFLLFVIIIILSINIFNRSFYFDFDKSIINNFFSSTLNFKNFFKNPNQNTLVNTLASYQKIDNRYYSSDGRIYSIDDGIIIYANNGFISIMQSNNYKINYKGEFIVQVKDGDYIEKNVAIGYTYESFVIEIFNDNVSVPYEEYIKNSI